MDQQFAGQVVVITGGSQGLGEATARLMAARGAAGLVLVARSVEQGEATARSIAEDTGTETLFVAADLGRAEAPAAVMAAADERFGRVDVLVNAAALTVRGSVWDASAELWDQMYTILSLIHI